MVAKYRGKTAFGLNASYVHDSRQEFEKLLKLAHHMGFTHVAMVGEWSWWPDGMKGLGTYPIPD